MIAANDDTIDSCVCSEFLIHAADVEGLCQGIDEQLVESGYSNIRWIS